MAESFRRKAVGKEGDAADAGWGCGVFRRIFATRSQQDAEGEKAGSGEQHSGSAAAIGKAAAEIALLSQMYFPQLWRAPGLEEGYGKRRHEQKAQQERPGQQQRSAEG